MQKNRKQKEPTLCIRVEAVLEFANDFLTANDVAKGAGITPHQAMSSLIYLRNWHAVESVESNGRLFWFATKEYDRRVKIVEQRAVEDKPRRNNRKGVLNAPKANNRNGSEGGAHPHSDPVH